ncbi:hypothetical protein C8Q77DRAFT_674596 [Trametes polyzona]|nr:hypothetical protein C8Q77DRAFT_674596 [Trametes polyzona]
MKHLRRNRSTSVSTPSPSTSSSHQPVVSSPTSLSPHAAASAAKLAAERTRPSHETPLYARFTSSHRKQETPKPLVSGPLALGPRKAGQTPVPVPAPPPIQQQKSSDSRKERERDRTRQAEGRTELKGILKSDETRNQRREKEEGASGAMDEDSSQVRRMPSDGTALSAGSGSATGLGLHGARVDGERVLLPERKRTRKRNADPSSELDAGDQSKDEVRVIGDRVLLPARKVTRKRVDVNASPEGAKDVESPRAGRPTLGIARNDSEGTSSASAQSVTKSSTSSTPSSARPNELRNASTGAVEKTRARAKSPEPESHTNLGSPIAFPASTSPSSAPAAGVSAPVPARTVVVVVRADGTDDQFSTPKRARMHTLATTTPASRPAPSPTSPEAPKSPTTRSPVEEAKSSESTGAKPAGNEGPSTASRPPNPAASSVTSQPSTSSVATGGAPPRRRKYSLRAAFGLPVPSDSDAGRSNVVTAAKPPTLSSSAAPPSSAPPPPRDDARPSASASDPQAHQVTDPSRGQSPSSRRRAGDVQTEQPSLSDPPASHSDGAQKQQPAASSSAPEHSKPGDRARGPSFDIPARPAPIPLQHAAPPSRFQKEPRKAAQQQPPSRPAPKHTAAAVTDGSQKLHNIPRTIDLDHSLLPPESDTRYPITQRRSPTHTPPATSSPSHQSSPRHKKSNSANGMARQLSPPPPSKADALAYPPMQRGPIQGRPLIFAAMAAAEAEAEIIEPKAWMAVATLDPDVSDHKQRPVLTERSDGSSQFVNGYPTPRSTSPKSLEPAEKNAKQDLSANSTVGRSTSEPVSDSMPAKETPTRRPTAPVSNVLSPPAVSTGLPTPTEPESRPRARKLSKSRSRVTRVGDASQQPPQPPTKASTLSAKPPTPVDDAPPPPRTQEQSASSRQPTGPAHGTASGHASTSASASAAALGSPIHLRNEKSLPERRSVESIRSPQPRVISSESPVPRRPVKVLTERQMEKLSATKGFNPASPSTSHGAAAVAGSRRRHEQSVPVSSPPPTGC